LFLNRPAKIIKGKLEDLGDECPEFVRNLFLKMTE